MTPSVSEYGHRVEIESGVLLRSWVLKDTWHVRRWLVVEVLIGILEFHDIAMEDDADREVFGSRIA